MIRLVVVFFIRLKNDTIIGFVCYNGINESF